MSRVTHAERIEQENELQALEFFRQALGALPDPRRRQGTRYPLNAVVVIALMAMICGCDDAEAMQVWGESNAAWLGGFLALPHGTPSQDVFLSVFAALDPKAFGAVLRAWTALLIVRLGVLHRHIAFDGKTSRQSFDSAANTPALHTVSAYFSDAGLVLGEVKTDRKSNEITAIPELLRLLDLRGATVTIDAMGCQTEIAKTIVNGEGHYLLAVKDNQPTLRADIEATFAESADSRTRAVDEAPRPAVEVFKEVDKGHGRVETRTVAVCRDVSWLDAPERWPDLAFVVQVTRERTVLATEKTSTEVAYYIGSETGAAVADIARDIRRHWAIENELHWVLDMAFREDEARHRAKNTAQNMTTLRHFALNIIKQDGKRKLGVANSRKRAGWNRAYLLELLTGARG
jgi:predicted transposase YbfD/YdcC